MTERSETQSSRPSRRRGAMPDRADGDRRRAPTRIRPRREPSIAGERVIKDAVLRMGILVEDAIRAALDALVAPRRRAARSR